MKKNAKRLHVNGEVILRLSHHHLTLVQGGSIIAPTHAGTCKTVHGISCDDCLATG